MKRVYFDTNIYNHIVDHPRSDSIKKFLIDSYHSKELEVLFSVNIFEEICCTKNVERRNKLLRLVSSVCGSHRFTLSHLDLIKNEVEKCEPVNNIYDETDFKNIIQETIDTEFSTELLNKIKERKSTSRDHAKDIIQKLEPQWEKHKAITFDGFYQISLKNAGFKTLLEEIYIRANGNINKCDQNELISNLPQMPGFQCLAKYILVLIYKQHVMGNKPNRGDNMDMLHSVFIGYCNLFVTEDQDFLDTVHLFDELRVKCLSFSEFLKSTKC